LLHIKTILIPPKIILFLKKKVCYVIYIVVIIIPVEKYQNSLRAFKIKAFPVKLF